MSETHWQKYNRFLLNNKKILWVYFKLRVFRVVYAIKKKLFWDKCFNAIHHKKKNSDIVFDEKTVPAIISHLKKNNINVKEYTIDIEGYKQFVRDAQYTRFMLYQKRGASKTFAEKSLEHYVAARLLEISSDDIYIDIANSCSPTPEIYNALYGATAYRQDLLYPEGIKGNIIGGDAGQMPLPDGFATKMAMHCAFEHFEGDADIRFIREAGRVLRSKGKLCIVPLYLFTDFAIKTNPVMLSGKVSFDEDATLYCVKNWFERHGRFYDVPHLISRVMNIMGGLNLTVYSIKNAREADPSCYLRFAAVFEKK
ncbi:MAG: methyltransferase domain-containing protein [Candidatus Auribacterota bacterium]